jgi:DNA-binding NarL/FixJ family response regulator
MIRILVADEHPIVRKGLSAIFENVPGMTVHCEARNAREILEILSQKEIDVVILDVAVSDTKSDLETLREIKRLHPQVPVLLYTISCEGEAALRALRIGVAGCVSRFSALHEVVKAVRKIARGGKYFSEIVAAKIVEQLSSPPSAAPHQELSNREFQIMQKIASGKPLKAIAQELYLSSKTVTTYRTRILTKMRLRSNAEIAQYALTRMRN